MTTTPRRTLAGFSISPLQRRRRRPTARAVRAVRSARRGGLAVCVLLLAACAGDPGPAGDEETAENGILDNADAPAAQVEGVAAYGPWVREAIRPGGADEEGAAPVNSAGYVVIRNMGQSSDALVGVDAAISDTVEIHSVRMDDGVMRMRPVDSVAVPVDGEAVLEPGGYHIMFIGVRDALEEGDSVPLTLRFRSGRALELVAPVLRTPPPM